MRNLAIIPARSGSKGLPDKNVCLLNGKPLVAYAIEAAHESEMFDEVMVSTDSERYMMISESFGASVPFLRSAVTASDSASPWDAVREVLENYAAQGVTFDTFCLLQPTSPLRRAEDIRAAYELFEVQHAKAIVSVCEVDHSPLYCNTLPTNGSLVGFLKEGGADRRQDHPPYYRINGAIYLSSTAWLSQTTSIYESDCYALVMARRHSVDIDGEIDLVLAEALLNRTA